MKCIRHEREAPLTGIIIACLTSVPFTVVPLAQGNTPPRLGPSSNFPAKRLDSLGAAKAQGCCTWAERRDLPECQNKDWDPQNCACRFLVSLETHLRREPSKSHTHKFAWLTSRCAGVLQNVSRFEIHGRHLPVSGWCKPLSQMSAADFMSEGSS